DLDGRLRFVNPEYTKVLGKEKTAVENRLSKEIWGGALADLIMAHDDMVRKTKHHRPYVSVERLPTPTVEKDRLNLRYPIFERQKLVRTGTIGFDYSLLRRAVGRLAAGGNSARAYIFDD